MTSAHVALGVVGVNVILVLVGFALLWPLLRGRTWPDRLSYAGVAFFTGAGSTLVALCCSAVVGARTTPALFVEEAVALAVLGLVVGLVALRRSSAAPAAPRQVWATSLAGDLVATVSCFLVVTICAFGVVGGLRSTPWLDDVWGFWVPKGIALDRIGLHADVLVRNHVFSGFTNPSYPFLWSILTDLDLRFSGSLDLRTVNLQEAIFVVAFVAALARLLQGRVRPTVLWPLLLVFVASPAVFRQAQSGEADLPLACFLGVFVLGSLVWLRSGDRIGLGLVLAGAAGALATKNEGLPLGASLLAVLMIAALRWQPRRLAAMLVASLVALGTAYPWFHWRASHHGATYDITTKQLFSPHYLGARTDQARRAAEQVVKWTTTPHEWFPIVPLVFVICVLGLMRTRKAGWLFLALLVLAPTAMLVWALWADPQDAVATSYLVYRLVTPIVFVAVVLLLVGSELLVRAWRAPPESLTAP